MVMPLRYIDGFDDIDGTHETTWFQTGGWGTPVTGRHGVGLAATGNWEKTVVGSPWDYMSAGIAFKMSALGTGVLRFIGSGVVAAGVQVNGSGHLQALKAGSVVAATHTGIALSVGVWYHVGVACRAHDTLGQIRIWLNGAPISALSLDNIDTEPGASPGKFVGVQQSSVLVTADDLWICSNNTIAGSLSDEFLGDLIVRTHFPQGDGEHTAWTPLSGSTRYEMVDEIGPDDDTSYDSDATPGNRMCFPVGSLAADLASIRAVQLCSVGRYDTTGPHSIRNYVRQVGVANHDSAAQGLTTQHVGYHDLLEVDPVTGVTWTASGFNARQWGVKDES